MSNDLLSLYRKRIYYLINELRENGYSREKIGRVIGVSYTRVKQIEQKGKRVERNDLVKIAKKGFLDVQ